MKSANLLLPKAMINEGVIFRFPRYLDSLQYATYWGKGEGHNLPTKVAIDNDDNVYICGYTTSDSLPMPIGGNPENYYSEPISDQSYSSDVDGYFLKLSPDCELLWSTYFFTRNSISDDKVLSIASDGGNRLYFAGTVNPKSDEVAGHHIPYQDYNSSTMDYYQNAIVNPQFNEGFMGCFDSLKTDNTAGISFIYRDWKDNILVYPNPCNSLVNILLPSICVRGEMEVLNILGQPLICRKIENTKAVSIEISSYSPGSYIVLVQDEGAIWFSKFVKQ